LPVEKKILRIHTERRLIDYRLFAINRCAGMPAFQ
jgi:hypothetical protein